MVNKKPRFSFMISVVLFSILFGLNTLVQAQFLNQEEFLLETNSWLGEKAEQILEDTVNKFVHDKWNNKQDKTDSGWVKVLTHEAFPEYEIKLKEPRICDPTVKQVCLFIFSKKMIVNSILRITVSRVNAFNYTLVSSLSAVNSKKFSTNSVAMQRIENVLIIGSGLMGSGKLRLLP